MKVRSGLKSPEIFVENRDENRAETKIEIHSHSSIYVRSTNFASNGAKIEPALRIYPGSHHMCITNEDLDKGRGNGTLCKCLKVKLRMEGGREGGKIGMERRYGLFLLTTWSG